MKKEHMKTIKFKSRLDEEARKAYAEFEKKVQRTVFLNNLSPKVTSAVITKALNQFGDVVSVEFIPNYTIPFPIPQCALVEMKDPKQAEVVLALMDGHPFMISGMPRPARAQAAEPEMFANRPSIPGREFEFRWVNDPSDPEFEVVKDMKRLFKQHTRERLALIKQTLAEEEKLAKQHAEVLNVVDKKHMKIEKAKKHVSVLAQRYRMI